MQPADNKESIKATKTLASTGVCLFDLSKNDARFKPIAFGSRSCTVNEKCLHSFTGEAACGRWAIVQNKRFLWGCHFWWICDCSAVKEILEYDGPIPISCRWAQELLGYQFTVVHRSNRMMVDVDSPTRRFGPLTAYHCMIAGILQRRGESFLPTAYDSSSFHTRSSAKLSPPIQDQEKLLF